MDRVSAGSSGRSLAHGGKESLLVKVFSKLRSVWKGSPQRMSSSETLKIRQQFWCCLISLPHGVTFRSTNPQAAINIYMSQWKKMDVVHRVHEDMYCCEERQFYVVWVSFGRLL